MPCAIFNLPDAKTDKTWNGLTASLSSTGTTFAEELSAVTMTFKLAGTVALTLTSAGGDITIDDAAAWEFTVLPITRLSLAAGVYSWAIETTSAAPSIQDYFVGTLNVISDTTA
jgi:hypothetical protein